MKVSQAMIDKLKADEGFRATMYHDAAGLPTIGYGTLIDTAAEIFATLISIIFLLAKRRKYHYM